MSFLIKSGSHNDIINTSSIDFFDSKISSLKLFSSKNSKSKKNSKFSNNFVFTKRDIYYNKSLAENKKTFMYKKYHKKISIDEISKIMKNKTRSNENKINPRLKKNKSMNDSSLFITDFIYKPGNTSCKRINKTHFYQIDKNNISYKNNNIKKNFIINNYLTYYRGEINKNINSSYIINSSKNNRKINLKLYKPEYSLKLFELETEMEKKNNKRKIESEYKQLFIKSTYLNNYSKKEVEKNKYKDSFNDYHKEKSNLNILKEKMKILEENIQNELISFNNKENTAKKNLEKFNEIFFVKFYGYIKKLSSQLIKEKKKNEKYIEYISSLKKEINNLNNNIKKANVNIEFLNKFAILNAKIKLKKLILPEYFQYILENKKNEMNKYKLNKDEINNILQYKRNINFFEILSIIENYENNDINLLKELDYLKNDIHILIKQKKDAMNKYAKYDDLEESINKNIILVNDLKSKYDYLSNNKKILMSYYYPDKNNTSSRTKKQRRSTIIVNYFKMYEKVTLIFNNLNNYIKYDFGEFNKPKLNQGMKHLIIYMFSKIEVLINILLRKINDFKQENPEQKDLFEKMVEKREKMREDLIMRRKREYSSRLKAKKMEEKFKKITPGTRMKFYNIDVLAKNKIRNKSKKIIKIETIFDYLN